MSLTNDFTVSCYDFDANLFNELHSLHYAKNLWPLVYILSNSNGKIKEAYVGETTDVYSRMGNHLRNNDKNKLTTVHLITSNKFNKSATLDIESNLIKYISGDGKFKLLNANTGLANHNFYNKDLYTDLFKTLWENLRAQGISEHSLAYIDNSDLFKYSPYKSLGQDQKQGLLVVLKNLLSDQFNNIIVEGGAGTGKTILAIFLFKLLKTNIEDFNFKEFGDDEAEFIELILELKKKYPNPSMALIIPVASFRSTIQKVFKNIKGLSPEMVIGPSSLIDKRYDIAIVDESHRLRRRVNLGSYYGTFDKVCAKFDFDKMNCSELDWVTQQSDKSILFYDEGQSIKPSDVETDDFEKLKNKESTNVEFLSSQLRVRGGKAYVQYLDKLLKCKFESDHQVYRSKKYEFLLFDSLEDMVSEVERRDTEYGFSRLIAGYSWKWDSQRDKEEYDIRIGNLKLRWNSVSIDWINSKNSINEVGCIHTTQGYDLNYAGIIFGTEITYDRDKNEIVILKENYHDKNGKNSIRDPEQLKRFIINIYKTVMLRAMRGTYVYVCDVNLKTYLEKYIDKYRKGDLATMSQRELIPYENCVPLYNLEAAAGLFSELQDVKDFEWIEIPSRYKAAEDLFAFKVVGESMNKIIPNGSICLFRKYTGGSRNGKIVLVESTHIHDLDFGSGYTVKEYHSKKTIEDEEWSHQSIILKPLSQNPEFENIELSGAELTTLKVVSVFECVLI
jgi:DUF2075 family protein/predicted GIY-YIG superfamily endonuclease/SOS-response transcriptional repressor LexA